MLKSDILDECCEQMLGHTNWAYFDTLTKKEQEYAVKNEKVVVFFEERANEDGDYESPFPISEEEARIDQRIFDEITNFIEYFASDETERDNMKKVLDAYFDEAYKND